ncbi:MAG: response regulator [Proteobacteria bacterium]|nr:response regulator [Pseudomonadota bacterium]
MDTKEYKERILVVDDNPTIHPLYRKILADEYTVMSATSGREALKALEEAEPPDLILLDIVMPEMDGYEVFRRLKEDRRTADIPVIFVTALGSETDELKGLETGAVDYIAKPIDKVILKARIDNTIELSRYTANRVESLPELSDEFYAADPSDEFDTIDPSIESDSTALHPPVKDRPKILVVDDERITHELIDSILKKNYEIVHLYSGIEIFEYLEGEITPDIILLDIGMPGIDGFETIKRLKAGKKTESIPVVFISARTSPEDEVLGFQLGCVDYMTKPISRPILKARVHVHLELSRYRLHFERQLDEFMDE